MTSIRRLMSIVESQIVSEIDIGGVVDGDHLYDLQKHGNYDPRQLDLFRDKPTPVAPELPHKGGMKIAGRLGEYFVVSKADGRPGHVTYYVFNRGTPIAYAAVQPPHVELGDGGRPPVPNLHGDGLRVISVYIDEQYRGRGLALSLYEWLLKNVCDYILPDGLQTPGGVFIWKSMLRDRRFDVMVYDDKRYTNRRRKPGKDFDAVYGDESWHLWPWATLRGKALDLIDGPPDE